MFRYLPAGLGALAVVAMTVPAQAEWRHPAARVVVVPHHGPGPGAAWGVASGLAALGIVGALAAPPVYAPPPVYYAPPPIYYGPPTVYWRGY